MTGSAVEFKDAVTEWLGDGPFGLLVTSADGRPLDSWIDRNRAALDAALDEAGTVMFRGFDVPDAEAFGAAARSAAAPGELLEYFERTAPRTEVANGVFTSTDMSPDRPIGMHHEMSYAHQWPERLFFFCDIPAATGGATPVGDDRMVYASLPVELRERFERDGVRYVRNYGPFIDLPWQEVFQTSERAIVEAYCAEARMECTWTEGDGLRTVARRQAVVTHPRTGEKCWFNHAHLFHASTLPTEVAEILLDELGTDGLPRNTTYGDGTPIESEAVAQITAVLEASTHTFAWQRGDVMLVDNVLSTHGREPFTGERRILVAMAGVGGVAA